MKVMHNHWLYITPFLDVFATSLLMPLMAVHLREAGLERLMAGLLISVYPMVQLLSSPAAGLCSDHCGHKHTLVCSLVLSAVSYYGFGTAAYPLSICVWQIAIGLLKHTQTLCKSLLVVLYDNHAPQFAAINAAEAFGFMIGPIVGSHLIEMKISFPCLCNITSVIFLINSLIVFFFFPDDKYQITNEKDIKSVFKVVNKCQEGDVIDWAIVWDIFVLKWYLCVSLSVFYTNFAFITVEKFKMAPHLIGYTNSFQSFISVITALLSVKSPNCILISEHDVNIIVCYIILSFSFLGSGLATSIFAFIFSLVPLTITSTLIRMYTTKILLHSASPINRGSLIGLENTLSSIAFILSPFIVEISILLFGTFYVPLLPALISSLGVIFLCVKHINLTKHTCKLKNILKMFF